MSLKNKLLEDLKQSMKEKDTIKKSSITMVRAAILQIEKDNKIELTDDDIIEVIAKQVKQRNDALKAVSYTHLDVYKRQPEGGFDETEIRMLEEKGVFPISLGPRILRTETAGFVVVTILMYELGDIGGF